MRSIHAAHGDVVGQPHRRVIARNASTLDFERFFGGGTCSIPRPCFARRPAIAAAPRRPRISRMRRAHVSLADYCEQLATAAALRPKGCRRESAMVSAAACVPPNRCPARGTHEVSRLLEGPAPAPLPAPPPSAAAPTVFEWKRGKSLLERVLELRRTCDTARTSARIRITGGKPFDIRLRATSARGCSPDEGGDAIRARASLKFRLSGNISQQEAALAAKNCGLLHRREHRGGAIIPASIAALGYMPWLRPSHERCKRSSATVSSPSKLTMPSSRQSMSHFVSFPTAMIGSRKASTEISP
jgi:hypothetical protein